MTNTFSGSDFRELCRSASVNRIRSFIRDGNVLAEGEDETRNNKILPKSKWKI
jgi:hypothetical protein